MRAEKIGPIMGLAAIVAMTAAFIAYPIDSGGPALTGSASPSDPPRPSVELAPFEWHSEPIDLPDLSFTTADGETTTLADLHGRSVLVNLWATWCAPCLREMPMLDRLAQDAAGPGLSLIALNQDRGGLDVAAPYWDDKNFAALTLYLDPGLVTGRALKPRGLPLTVLIDPNGREIARLAGIASWDNPEVIAYFKAISETTN